MAETEGGAPRPVPDTEGMWSPPYRLLTAGLLLVVSAAAFESLAVATILPMVVRDLGGLALYGWAFSLFTLANLLEITLAGSAAARQGPAPPLAAGIGVFTVGLVGGGLAPTMPVLIASRAFQGLGSGVLTAAVYVAIGRRYPDTLRARMLASLSSAWVLRYTARGAVSLERLTQDTNGDLVYTFTHRWSDGTTGIRLSPLELLEKLAALVPLPRVHLVRYGGCLAPHSHLRGAIIPTPRQQGVEEQEDSTASPHWSRARLLERIFALDMTRCPWCQRGAVRIIAAITQGEVIRTILRHLKLAAAPPPIATARVHQEAFAWSSA